MNTARPVVIGLGSPHGDDRAGWAVVDALQRRGLSEARRARDGADLLAALEDQHDVVLVDASEPAGTPGRVRVLAWPFHDAGDLRQLSTHGIGLIDALRMADVLERAPERVTIVAIEAQATKPGAKLSPPVVRAIAQVVNQLLKGDITPTTNEGARQ